MGSYCIDQYNRAWYAVKVKFRAEKFVKELLQREGIESYVPLIQRQRLIRAKVRTTEIPLIHNYVFVRIKRSEYVSVLQTTHVFSFVQIVGMITAIPEQEIDLLRRIVNGDGDIELCDRNELKSGQLVEVIAGDLTGLRGEIVECANGSQLVVDLKNISISLRMTIDASQVIPLSLTV